MRAEEQVRHKVTIRKGDLVRVMKGRDREAFREKTSRVLSVDAVAMTVTVEHAHIIKRHTRPNPQRNIKGGIVEREAALHASNVQLVCPECAAMTRVGHRFLNDGRKVRVCRKCEGVVDK